MSRDHVNAVLDRSGITGYRFSTSQAARRSLILTSGIWSNRHSLCFATDRQNKSHDFFEKAWKRFPILRGTRLSS